MENTIQQSCIETTLRHYLRKRRSVQNADQTLVAVQQARKLLLDAGKNPARTLALLHEQFKNWMLNG